MDSQDLREDDPQRPPTGPRAPRPSAPTDVSGEPVLIDPPEHNVVFTSLVTGDKDIVGLIAYSIYKQNKYDWLLAFSRTQGRMPDEVEAQSYLLGESTARRLATYRHLAEATLGGTGPKVAGAAEPALPGRSSPGLPRPPLPGARVAPSSRPLLIGLAGALVLLLLLFWFLHGGFAPPKP